MPFLRLSLSTKTIQQLAVVLVGLSIPLYPVHLIQDPHSICDVEAYLVNHSSLRWTYPEKLVVQPWKGQHHVYALFELDDRVAIGEPILVAIRSGGVSCRVAWNSGRQIEGVMASTGKYLMYAHMRTRDAIPLILQGYWSEMTHRSNWSVIYPNR